MGSHCSANLGPKAGCLKDVVHCEHQCGPCGDDYGTDAVLSAEHPLLAQMQEQGASSSTPRTPRGPVPPWAVASEWRQVDRTATGATPPRSPTPPRATPPGLPEDDMQNAGTVLSLAKSFGPDFTDELFAAARHSDTASLISLIQQVNSTALALVANSLAGFQPHDKAAPSAANREEKAAELTAGFLSKLRHGSGDCSETLLGVAALHGKVLAVQALLLHKADPLAADDKGCTALHKAAEGGQLLSALVLLDRLQSNDRSISVAELMNRDGETPEMSAALVGASDLCSAFEVFSNMQHDAEMRQLGSMPPPPDPAGGHRAVGTGDVLSCIDLEVEGPSAKSAAAALLRRSSIGTRLVPNLFTRIPEDQKMLSNLVERVCKGLVTAENFLYKTNWNSADPGLDPALRSFVVTAELRSTWQRIRQGALQTCATKSVETQLEDFWQTHLNAEAMVLTIRQATGDTFQLLLTALWLYTREAWLRHLLDALASTLHAASVPPSADYGEGTTGTTGAATEWSSMSLPAAFQLVKPLVEALAPCMQLVQSALGWFEEANIRHTAVTYRPLSLPMLGLQKLVDRYIALRRQGDASQSQAENDAKQASLESGAWLSLGAGSFFSSLSLRHMAIKRLARTRCNALLIIKPDVAGPSYPKHMSLRGSSVDDTMFPLETLFRITRVTRTVSSDLDADGHIMSGMNSRWPVMIIEVYASNRYSEAMELLQKRNELCPGELASKLEEWARCAPTDHEAERLLEAGQVISRAAVPGKPGDVTRPSPTETKALSAKATQLLAEAALAAEAASLPEVAAQALLAKAKSPGSEWFLNSSI
eukprot:TRINITY_DN14483_c0_g1_i1.p1 TRINITY_DN14483_c0_g1~~TRINITY_DN14483_c0_g1_i1.p1  ORF type:complete len:833 (-),score=197.72 TRINITY_DN14483_c0_g1_i1:43-2508(-)